MHQTCQNTQINATQGMAEEQFAAIATAARTEALYVIEDLLTDDESVDYSTPETQTVKYTGTSASGQTTTVRLQ